MRYIEIYPGQKFSPEKARRSSITTPRRRWWMSSSPSARPPTSRRWSTASSACPTTRRRCRKVFEFAKKLGLQTIVSEPPFDALELHRQDGQRVSDQRRDSQSPQAVALLEPRRGAEGMRRAARSGSARVPTSGTGRARASSPPSASRSSKGRSSRYHLKDIDEKKEDVDLGQRQVRLPALLAETKRQGDSPGHVDRV